MRELKTGNQTITERDIKKWIRFLDNELPSLDTNTLYKDGLNSNLPRIGFDIYKVIFNVVQQGKSKGINFSKIKGCEELILNAINLAINGWSLNPNQDSVQQYIDINGIINSFLGEEIGEER